MNRPLSLAFASSAALHIAVAAAVYWLVTRSFEPAPASRLLVLSIEATSPDAPFDGGVDVKTDVESPDPMPRSAARSTEDAPAPTPQEAPTPVPSAKPKQRPVPTSHAVAATDPRADVDVETTESAGLVADQAQPQHAVEPADVALTTSASDERVAVVEQDRLTRAIDEREAAMLEEKLAAWTRDDESLPDLADGDSWVHDGKSYTATFTALPARDDTGLDYIDIEIATEDDGLRRIAGMRLKRMAFSNYTQFIHRWDPSVQIHDDILDGRFHSNTKINVAYDSKVAPKFRGKVTTAARRVNYIAYRGSAPGAAYGTSIVSTRSSGWVRRPEIFAGGLETGVERIPMPERFVPFPYGTVVAERRIDRLDDDAHIEFYPDGTYSVETESAGERWVALGDETHYILGAPKKTVRVSGVVDGKVLVYSPQKILVVGDLTYADDPRTNLDADDYLGLVADQSVEIARPSVTGPGDLELFAAIYAKRRFAVRRYKKRGNDLLFLYGSLSAGSLSATEPRYRTELVFDKRLERQRPPAYPMTDRFELDRQDTSWTVQPVVASD